MNIGSDLYLHNNRLYFSSLDQEGGIFSMSLYGGEYTPSTNVKANRLVLDDGYIYTYENNGQG